MSNLIEKALEKYDVGAADIFKLKEDYMHLKVNDPTDVENYEIVKSAHQDVKKLRIRIDVTRKDLKAESLAFGRAVDTKAKELTVGVLEVESHLFRQRKVVEDEKERIEQEARDAEIARIEAENKAEAEKVEAEHKAQQEILDAQRKEQEEQAAKIKEAQDKIDADKDEINAEKAKIEEERAQIERDKQEAINIEVEKKKAADEAVEAEKARVEREQSDKAKIEADALAYTERLESIAPDIDKIKKLSDDIKTLAGSIGYIEFQSNEAFCIADEAECQLQHVAKVLEDWTVKNANKVVK